MKNCLLTDDRRYLANSSAVVFHIRDLKLSDLPRHRTTEQLYVFFLVESPPHTNLDLSQAPWPGFFNLTWTYRRDSDIFNSMYLDRFSPQPATDENTTRSLFEKRKNKAVLLSSNCLTSGGRERLVEELRLWYPIDVLGGCGSRCGHSTSDCDDILKSYKFYLAFENSNCTDYLTEKALRGFNLGLIQVVYGGANYSEIFPGKSFINVADSNSTQNLGDHLWAVSRDFQSYRSYFEWKNDPQTMRFPDFYWPANTSTCKLCELLNNQEPTRKIYEDIQDWWVNKGHCSSWESHSTP